MFGISTPGHNHRTHCLHAFSRYAVPAPPYVGHSRHLAASYVALHSFLVSRMRASDQRSRSFLVDLRAETVFLHATFQALETAFHRLFLDAMEDRPFRA